MVCAHRRFRALAFIATSPRGVQILPPPAAHARAGPLPPLRRWPAEFSAPSPSPPPRRRAVRSRSATRSPRRASTSASPRRRRRARAPRGGVRRRAHRLCVGRGLVPTEKRPNLEATWLLLPGRSSARCQICSCSTLVFRSCLLVSVCSAKRLLPFDP